MSGRRRSGWLVLALALAMARCEAAGGGGDSAGGAVALPGGIGGSAGVQFTTLQDGDTVSGVVVVGVAAEGAAEVRTLLDGAVRHVTSEATASWSWDTTAGSDGPSLLTVVAVDAAGVVVASSTLRVLVANGPAGSCPLPEAQITYPPDQATLCGVVEVQATASAACGLAVVEVQVDGVTISAGHAGEAPSAPWDTTSVADGAHILRLKATDTQGQSRHDLRVVTVDNAVAACNSPPAAILTAPAPDSCVNGLILLEALATDGDGAVVQVSFLVDDAELKTLTAPPYAALWRTDLVAEGAHSIRVVATDDGHKTGEAQRTVTVDRTPPTVSLTSPANGAVVPGDLALEADAADAGGIESVSFGAASPGGHTALGVVTAPPYRVSWHPAGPGPATLTAVARDRAGLVAMSSVDVVVDGPPSVAITSPSPGEIVAGPQLLVGAAWDDVGIAEVQIRLDGAPLAQVGGGPFSVPWSADGLAPGTHELRATATDTRGATATDAVQVTVETPAPPDLQVEVCTSLAFSDCGPPPDPLVVTGPVYLRAQAADGVPVLHIALLIDGHLTQTDAVEPYELPWDSTSVALGPHTLAIQLVGPGGVAAQVSLEIVCEAAQVVVAGKLTSVRIGQDGQEGEALDVDPENGAVDCAPVPLCTAGLDNQLTALGSLSNPVLDTSLTAQVTSCLVVVTGHGGAESVDLVGGKTVMATCENVLDCLYVLTPATDCPLEGSLAATGMTDGHVEAGGDDGVVIFRLPLAEDAWLPLKLRRARLVADFPSSPDGGPIRGVIGGAVRHQDLLAAVDAFPTEDMGGLPKSTVKLFLGSLQGDVDTDGDGQDDAISVGITLEAIPAALLP